MPLPKVLESWSSALASAPLLVPSFSSSCSLWLATLTMSSAPRLARCCRSSSIPPRAMPAPSAFLCMCLPLLIMSYHIKSVINIIRFFLVRIDTETTADLLTVFNKQAPSCVSCFCNNQRHDHQQPDDFCLFSVFLPFNLVHYFP